MCVCVKFELAFTSRACGERYGYEAMLGLSDQNTALWVEGMGEVTET